MMFTRANKNTICALPLALLAAACGNTQTSNDPLWGSRDICRQVAEHHEQGVAADDAFVRWLGGRVSIGDNLAAAYSTLESEGFSCIGNVCKKIVGDGFGVTRHWIVGFERDEHNRVSRFNANCAYLGL